MGLSSRERERGGTPFSFSYVYLRSTRRAIALRITMNRNGSNEKIYLLCWDIDTGSGVLKIMKKSRFAILIYKGNPRKQRYSFKAVLKRWCKLTTF